MEKLEKILKDNFSLGASLYQNGFDFINEPSKAEKYALYLKGQLPKANHEWYYLQEPKADVFLNSSLQLILRYLRHSHGVFINEKLPYFQYLISGLNEKDITTPESYCLIADLKVYFPLFVEEFIAHIFHEESSIFLHLDKLVRAKNSGNVHKLYNDLSNNSISSFLIQHDEHDDEMEGIKEITNNFKIPAKAHTVLATLLKELLHFEKVLQIHAEIEETLLFPKAVQLENELRIMMKELSTCN